MAEEEAPLLPGAEDRTEDSTEGIDVSFRPRREYAGYRAFGGGEGAVLIEPKLARELRSAAEFATQEGRVTGGLLYGCAALDDQGAYLVINGFVEAGPGENGGDRISPDAISPDDPDDFTLLPADLRLLRADGARTYPGGLELGWWRSRAELGEFGPRDFATQAELIGPDGVGLLVYGSGVHWGTAYLGPDGHAPDSAGTLVEAPGATSGPPESAPQSTAPEFLPEEALEPEPRVVNVAAGESLRRDPRRDIPPAAPGRTRPGISSRVRVPPRVRGWAGRPAYAAEPGPETPGGVQLVVVAMAIAFVAVAIIIGFLVHSVIVAVIIAAVGLLAIFSFLWFSRR